MYKLLRTNKMRNLEKYLNDFDELPFESTQSSYRKENFCEVIEKFKSIKKVLEVGCGTSSIFEHYKFEDQTLVEPIEEFIIRLHQRSPSNDIATLCCTVEEIDTLDRYDLIVASCILHEVSDQGAFISQIKNLLTDDGYLFLDVPNAYSLHRQLAVETGYLQNIHGQSTTQSKMQQDNEVFNKVSLHRFLEQNGFNIIEYGGYFVKPFHHAKMDELVTNGQLTKKELDAFYQIGKNNDHLASEIYALCEKSNKR